MINFPQVRMRRNRRYEWIRDLVAEHTLEPRNLIWPVFVKEGVKIKEPIPTMPGVYRYSIDLLVEEVKRAYSLGIPAIALFPVVDKSLKSEHAEEAYNPNNLICRAIKALKEKTEIGVICDVALDPYTLHGHDGIIINNYVDNDETLEVLAKQAIVQAQGGCDIIAPSDMMDGRVGVLRQELDQNGYSNTGILSYTAKYASNYYGPFRDAVSSRDCLGKSDKKTYQMDYRNSNEAINAAELDIRAGADMIMVKPGMPFLDIIRLLKDRFSVPIFAYQVSGEYAMLKFGAQQGCFDENAIMLESLISFKRAGASGILTYAAVSIAELLNK